MPPPVKRSPSTASTTSGPDRRLWMIDGQAELAGRPELGPQGLALGVARREVVVEVQADLADGPDRPGGGQLAEPGEVGVREVLGLVGVNARRGQDRRERLLQPEDRRQARRGR